VQKEIFGENHQEAVIREVFLMHERTVRVRR